MELEGEDMLLAEEQTKELFQVSCKHKSQFILLCLYIDDCY